MKKLITITIFLTTQLLANYTFSDEKSIKIDMHGGKSEKLSNKDGFSKIGSDGLKDLTPLTIKKPKKPSKPEEKNIPELQDIKLK